MDFLKMNKKLIKEVSIVLTMCLINIGLPILLLIFLTSYYFSNKDVKLVSPVVEVVVTPTPTPIVKKAVASYYDRSVCGSRVYGETCRTASMQVFNDQALTVAHKSLPFGTMVKFTYNGLSVVCKVNDRGPYIKGREFDLSKGCADAIGLKLGLLNYQIIK